MECQFPKDYYRIEIQSRYKFNQSNAKYPNVSIDNKLVMMLIFNIITQTYKETK